MSSLAEYLLDQGLQVSGCDSASSPRIEKLRAAGATIWIGHNHEHITDARSLVHTAAVPRDHPELIAARQRGVPVLPRALLLARLSRSRPTICVAGSHGKSSVTAMVAHILATAGLDPGYLIGAVLSGSGRGGYYGTGDLLVMETDEYDRTLERVSPFISVITNVDAEHLDVYGSFDRLWASFVRFARRGAAEGGAVLWAEDPGGMPQIRWPNDVISCGGFTDHDCSGETERGENSSIQIKIQLPNGNMVQAPFLMKGQHSIINAILASAAASLVHVEADSIARGLSTFGGLARRFEILGTVGKTVLVTDYAHHPTEILAAINAAKELGNPVIAVFQPHLYSRTARLYRECASALTGAHKAIVTGIYAARENPLAGISGRLIVRELLQRGAQAEYCEAFFDLGVALGSILGHRITLLFLTAGDLDTFARNLLRDH